MYWLHAPSATDFSRRRFVTGMALGSAVLGLGLWTPSRAGAQAMASNRLDTLDGTSFALDIGQAPVDFTGRRRLATTVNGGVPGPVLRWKQGTTVTLRVTNRLAVPTSIHWHGILLPFRDRKSTRLNSSHVAISYAVFCLKKKK